MPKKLITKKKVEKSSTNKKVDKSITRTKVKKLSPKKSLVKKNESFLNENTSKVSLEFVSETYKSCNVNDKGRSHFVIHSTGSDMTLDAIKTLTKYNTDSRLKSKGHIYVMKDGSSLEIWPLKEELIWATKAESLNNGKLKGKMFHIELNYDDSKEPSKEQYNTLAKLYIEASNLVKCWPTIVPHIEIDRGIKDGHSDPTNFDYNNFYNVLKKLNVPIESILKFDHNRYWGHESYKTPYATDKYNWPPILTGNPHK